MVNLGNKKLQTVLTLIMGSLIVSLWTFFRFFTKSINFDLVGQQLLSRQWLDGNFEGAITAPTNYILKMIFLYIPGELLDADPKLFLIIVTLVVNVLTFIGIYFILRKILKYFSINSGAIFNISMIWLATVAGSVFWIQFVNSRNIELLAGLVLLYLGLTLYRKMSTYRSLLFVTFAGLVYFADPLQLLVTSVILVVYVVLNSLIFDKTKLKQAFIIMLLITSGYLLSLVLVYVVQQFTKVDFFGVSSIAQSLAIFNNIPIVAMETIKNAIRLVSGTNELGVWRQILSALVVIILTALSIASIIRKREYIRNRNLLLFTLLMLITPIAVYIASGQPVFKADTSRYLIVLAPALVILFSISDLKQVSRRLYCSVVIAVSTLLLVSTISLVQATLKGSERGILSTIHLEERFNYLVENNHQYGYSSMDTAIPSMYFFGRNTDKVLLPLSCEKGILRKVALFYDKNLFITYEKDDIHVPIILDGDSINNYPSTCSIDSIKQQLGDPIKIDTNNQNTVLYYGSDKMKELRY